MRTSCNGCRVLRKGCTEDCNIRPCLQWIHSPDSQANATVFLAKFYGRAGLMNLINAGPEPLRPGIFKSLLYEACGRIVDPIHGSVGLLWSGNWQHCQAAVNAVLNGTPIVQFQPENAGGNALFAAPPLQAYDIRHVSRDAAEPDVPEPSRIQTRARSKRNRNRRTLLQQQPDTLTQLGENDVSGEYNDSVFSVATVEPSLANRVNPNMDMDGPDDNECELELTLGLHALRK